MPRRSLSGFLSRAPFLDTYLQEGENNAYTVFTNGSNVTVNAAATKPLQWTYTPSVDCWAEVTYMAGLVQKTDAAYNYAQLNPVCAPAPAIGTATRSIYKMQHLQVQTYDFYTATVLWGLTAGVAYAMRATWTTSGGTWQVQQNNSLLWMHGKSWPR